MKARNQFESLTMCANLRTFVEPVSELQLITIIYEGGQKMTTNQIAYWANQEAARANRAREVELERSNKERERETHRSNTASEAETRRSNLTREILQGVDIGLKNIQELGNKAMKASSVAGFII